MNNMRRICELATIAAGQGAPQGSENYSSEGVPFIKAGDLADLADGKSEYCVQKVSQEIAAIHKLKLFPKGTVLFAKSGMSCMKGIVHVLRVDCYVVSHLACIVPQSIEPAYLKYYLEFNRPNTLIKDNSYPSISLSDIAEMKVKVLPVEERLHITATLDAICRLIRIRKSQLIELDKLVKSRFIEMFGDPEFNTKNLPVVYLGDLCEVGSSKRIYQSEQSTAGIPFLRISDLVTLMDTGELNADLYIPENRYMELRKQGLVPKSGDILVTSRGTLGRCYIVQDKDDFYFQDGMISWLSGFSGEVIPLYIKYLFEMNGFRKQIDGLQAGSTVVYLSITMLKKLKVMLPSLALQQQFATFVQATDKSKLAVQKSLDELETLKKALMQKYFG